MKAMILAAGLGTRLRPLTNTRPKALVEISGRTLLEITLCRLRDFGVREVIVNVHHFADMITSYLEVNDSFGMRIEVSREDDLLLDTGGGLKKAGWFFLDQSGREEPFLVHNVDVVSTIDLRQLLEFQRQHDALATLAVQSRESSRYLVFNDQLALCGRRAAGRDQQDSGNTSSAAHTLAFTGIHVISPRLLRLMKEEGAFSIIDCYLRLAREGERILAFRADEYYWRDLGRPENIERAAEELREQA